MAGVDGGEDEDVLICSRWSRSTAGRLPGNRRGNCATCGCMVVISVEGQTFMRENPAVHVSCIPCAQRASPGARPLSAPGAAEAAGRALGMSPAETAAMHKRFTDIPLGEHVFDEDDE